MYAAGETDSAPTWRAALTGTNRVPWVAILVMWVVGVLFLLPFPAWQLMVAYIGFILCALHWHFIARRPASAFGWSHIAWLLPWFGGMWLLSAISDLGGAAAWIGFWLGVFLVIVWSLIVLAMAERTALSPAETVEIMARMSARG